MKYPLVNSSCLFAILLISSISHSQTSGGDACKPYLDAHSASTDRLCPAKLPSPREAVQKVQKDAAATGRSASADDMEKAYTEAIQAETNAVQTGHAELVAAEDLPGIKASIESKIAADAAAKAKAELDARNAAAEKERLDRQMEGWRKNMAEDEEKREQEEAAKQADIKKYHCPKNIRIGTPETCVYLLLGDPDHTNEDALSGKQLVYPNNYYVYINRRGLVEDIQSTY